jgi:hypothetical protein
MHLTLQQKLKKMHHTLQQKLKKMHIMQQNWQEKKRKKQD